MDDKARNLILAAEITGLLHDLGKLRFEFACETCKPQAYDWDEDACQAMTHINSVHGAILEEGRAYPPQKEEGWLQQIKSHPGWAGTLSIPDEWLQSSNPANPVSIQAKGLGDPLCEHHGNNSFQGFTLLGSLFPLGADIRDSALDKSGNPRGLGQQRINAAFLADSFGNEWHDRKFSSEILRANWTKATQIISDCLFALNAWKTVASTRARFLPAIRPCFELALGATLRPTNDVTLWHHAYSTASLHKVQVAEGVLRQDFSRWQDEQGLADEGRFGLIRFRLLGIRWDWASLARTALEPIVFAALATRRAEAIAALRQRIEVDYPIGNSVYQDDDGLVFVVPGFYDGDTEDEQRRAEDLFKTHILDPLLGSTGTNLLTDLQPLGAGVEVRLAWTRPRLYLTDYREVMSSTPQGCREYLLQVNEAGLLKLWTEVGKGTVAVCPSCGLRPGDAAERGLGDATLASWRRGYCFTCDQLSSRDNPDERFSAAEKTFGFRPVTFNLHDIRNERGQDNPRLALLSVQTDAVAIAEGAMLLTQVARPLPDVPMEFMPEQERNLNGIGGFFQHIYRQINPLQGPPIRKRYGDDPEHARRLMGDFRWITKKDGRIPQGDANERGLRLIHDFFLREWVPDELISPQHPIGDRLALFAVRKHASPGRLARFWSDLDQAWRVMLARVAETTGAYAAPLSLDVRGFRVIVAAADLRVTLRAIQEEVGRHFARVQGRFPLDISVAVFREKFPLYLALDAMRRLERRGTLHQPETWTLNSRREEAGQLHLTWDAGRGQDVNWSVPMTAADPRVRDHWYPYLICLSRPQGPGRLVHMADLQPGEQAQVRPMTFDYTVLEGSARRYQLRYNPEGRRPHYILGAPGRRPYLLDQMAALFDLAPATGWTASQSKAIVGQLIDAYGQWVRDMPATLRNSGLEAWQGHAARLLAHQLPGSGHQATRDALLAGLKQGLLFDTFDWNEFVEKNASRQMDGALAANTGARS